MLLPCKEGCHASGARPARSFLPGWITSNHLLHDSLAEYISFDTRTAKFAPGHLLTVSSTCFEAAGDLLLLRVIHRLWRASILAHAANPKHMQPGWSDQSDPGILPMAIDCPYSADRTHCRTASTPIINSGLGCSCITTLITSFFHISIL